jgi:nitrogen regulatory protein PII
VKSIRCTLQPFQLERVVDALDAFDISNLTVTAGGERCRDEITGVYRGCSYKVRFVQTSIIDITAPDDQVDGIVQTAMNRCGTGQQPSDGRILVMPVNEWYTVRTRPQRIA